MTIVYLFIRDSLERPFMELFSSNTSLWSQYKYITFNIFSCRILIILYVMLNTTGISNEKRNESIFCQQELASLFQVQEQLKACRSLK